MNVILFAVSLPPFYAQEYFRNMGIEVRRQLPNNRVGMSGAGIASFYQGGTIINLDGLVNNEIYQFMPERLHCYLAAREIEYFDGFGVSEWLFPIVPPDLYSTEILLGRFGTQELRLRKVDFEKLRAMPECSPGALARELS